VGVGSGGGVLVGVLVALPIASQMGR